MKRYLLFILLGYSVLTQAQVINFAKTLPVGSFSIGTAIAYNADTYVSDPGVSYFLYGGYGLGYSLDMNVKYGNYQGSHYFGADMQYLFRETRQSYFSFIGGMHWRDDFWVDLTGSYTRSVKYYFNLSAGLDIDIGLGTELDFRAWIPLNMGFNITEYMFMYLEYNLPANDKSWDILALGVNIIIR